MNVYDVTFKEGKTTVTVQADKVSIEDCGCENDCLHFYLFEKVNTDEEDEEVALIPYDAILSVIKRLH